MPIFYHACKYCATKVKALLDIPILYLSGYIIRNKAAYYSLFQGVLVSEDWEAWIIYMLQGIEEMSVETLNLVKSIHAEVEKMSAEIKSTLPKIYSRELIDLLFHEFYTKIIYIQEGLGVTRKTAAGYLNSLEQHGFLVSEKIGKERIYQNRRLYDLIKNPS
jgi:Fic family protein